MGCGSRLFRYLVFPTWYSLAGSPWRSGTWSGSRLHLQEERTLFIHYALIYTNYLLLSGGKPAAKAKIDFESLKKGYFAAMGWDIKTGKPHQQTLVEMGLDELTNDL